MSTIEQESLDGSVLSHGGTAVVDQKFPVAVTKIRRKNTPLAVGIISAGALTENYSVAVRDHKHGNGYQRPASTSRVNKLMDDLKNHRVDLPTAVLLNLRSYDPAKHLIQTEHGPVFAPSGAELYVVDGQHRIEALARLIRSSGGEDWADYEIPFACMMGASEMEELEQFYIVNSTAKSVRTDLAFDLLKQRAEADPEAMKGIVESGQDWKVSGERVAEALAQTDVWRDRIRFPGMEKGVTTINNSGMVNSIKPLLGTPYFGALDEGNQVKILDAFWRGVRSVLPEAFNDAGNFTIQKVTGVQVLHLVLVPAIEYIRSIGASVLEPESYADVLREPLTRLQETTANESIVSGSEFWRAGPEGAAGSFSSNAGRRVLTARIRGMLPQPEIS